MNRSSIPNRSTSPFEKKQLVTYVETIEYVKHLETVEHIENAEQIQALGAPKPPSTYAKSLILPVGGTRLSYPTMRILRHRCSQRARLDVSSSWSHSISQCRKCDFLCRSLQSPAPNSASSNVTTPLCFSLLSLLFLHLRWLPPRVKQNIQS